MHASFPLQHPKIMVAVAFDEHVGSLLEAATCLSQKTGAALRLVHVCDPWAKSLLATTLESGPNELVQALKQEHQSISARRLAALAGTLPKGLKVETAVLSGDVEGSLVADAEANGVGLLIIGAFKGGIAGTALGYSTAVSVITEAAAAHPIPVMVLNEAARLAPLPGKFTVLVADDFTPVAQAALSLGFGLAAAFAQGGGAANLVHCHVETYEELNLGRPVRPRLGQPEVAFPQLTPERLATVIKEANATLADRAAPLLAPFEKLGGGYAREVVLGAVPDEIDRTATACRADIAILGQHRVFHRASRHAGQVPFKAMLAQNRAVIVMPQQT